MSATQHLPTDLPQLRAEPFVTDGGMETDLIFHRGVDLPHFAAYPLLEDIEGRALLTSYYDGYASVAQRAGVGLMLESPTWRANPDWGHRLGHTARSLARLNEAAITFLLELRERYAATVPQVIISGMIGPRGDGYRPDYLLGANEAAAYHAPQIEAFATAGADLVTAYTLSDVGEALGIVEAARTVGIPVAISFTVETDGTLPSGMPLAEAIDEVDSAGGPDYFLLNCAHPTHIERGLTQPGAWRERIVGIRTNASTKSHAELDEAEELDEGDPESLATAQARVRPLLPRLSIIGGCCGTDTRHVARMWNVGQDAPSAGTPAR